MRIRRHRASIAQVFISPDRTTISQSDENVKLEQRVYVDYDKQKQIETKTERKQAVDNATNEIIEKLEKVGLKTTPVTHSINRNLGFSNYFNVEEVRKGRKTLTATTMWKKMSVQLTAESIRNSVSPNAQSDTDINIIPNPNTDVKLEQRAYAASRIDYEKPSLEVIGTGEGAQVHGLGLYYALRKYVAEGYRTNFL